MAGARMLSGAFVTGSSALLRVNRTCFMRSPPHFGLVAILPLRTDSSLSALLSAVASCCFVRPWNSLTASLQSSHCAGVDAAPRCRTPVGKARALGMGCLDNRPRTKTTASGRLSTLHSEENGSPEDNSPTSVRTRGAQLTRLPSSAEAASSTFVSAGTKCTAQQHGTSNRNGVQVAVRRAGRRWGRAT
jgi:hypothetical protein